MDSPPSSSSWSQAFILSDDSGLLLTNGSASSGSASFERRRHYLFEDSDCEERSLSQDDSLDGMSDVMCGENFNTLKKGPHWTDLKQSSFHIEPPLEFQDKPIGYPVVQLFCDKLTAEILRLAFLDFRESEIRRLRLLNQLHRPTHHLLTRPYFPPEFIPFSPCHMGGRPSSRSSLGSSRLSSSHNSLSVPTAHKVDDSTFITQAVSHDTLSSNQISDLYNVPFDSDVYAVPVDVLIPPAKPRRQGQMLKKRRRNTSSGCRESVDVRSCKSSAVAVSTKKNSIKYERSHWSFQNNTTIAPIACKRHSVAGTSAPIQGEPIHMTLQEVRHYLQTLYSSSDSSENVNTREKNQPFKPKSLQSNQSQNNNNIQHETFFNNNNNINNIATRGNNKDNSSSVMIGNNSKFSTSNISNSNNTNSFSNNFSNISTGINGKKNTFLISIKNKKVKDSCDNSRHHRISSGVSPMKKDTNKDEVKRKNNKLYNFKQTLCNMFRFRKFPASDDKTDVNNDKFTYISNGNVDDIRNNLSSRALPPLPFKEQQIISDEQILDFATSIQRVKDYGWYWGPISGEAAEKILSNEPDGSFIVRDSSDDHYIFSLTFKLNNYVRHVRIEHDQGNFSFGSCTKFKSQTIVEFIENAVEHSRSGRYLFFLHRRPVIGPVRVQLLHPVSRFKQVQSLQHICRFVIHKNVRRDLIPDLPLPRRMIDYLNTPHYYSEHFIDVSDESNPETTEPLPATQLVTSVTNGNLVVVANGGDIGNGDDISNGGERLSDVREQLTNERRQFSNGNAGFNNDVPVTFAVVSSNYGILNNSNNTNNVGNNISVNSRNNDGGSNSRES